MLSGNVLAVSTGCASSCVSQFKSKRSKANERISVWCFLGGDAAIYRVPVPGGRGIISLWIPRAVSGWRKRQIKECEMSLKQMQILDSTEAVKQERPAPCARHCEANAFKIVIRNLKAQLAQPEQEPVAWMDEEMTCIFFDAERPEPFDFDFWKPLYATPPQRKPLTDEEIDALAIDKDGLPNSHLEFARAIEAAHGIKE